MSILEIYTFLNKKGNRSGSVAKDRLKLVLIQDRINNSPEVLDEMRDEILKVISKYADIDMEGFNFEIEKAKKGKNGKISPAISANIPIKRLKKRVKVIKKELME